MTYSILDTGNLVVSFDDEGAAFAALDSLAADGPGAGDRLVMVAFDDDGHVVADYAPGERVADHV